MWGTVSAGENPESSGGAIPAVSQPSAACISAPRTATSLIPEQKMKPDMGKISPGKTYMSDDIKASVLFIVILILMHPSPSLHLIYK